MCKGDINLGSLLYDTLTVCISLADLSTDIIVLYQFYINDRMPFFWTSLVIIILAQLSYCFAFVLRFAESKASEDQVFIFFASIPISPFIALIIYLTSDEHSAFAQWFGDTFNLQIRSNYVDKSKPKMQQLLPPLPSSLPPPSSPFWRTAHQTLAFCVYRWISEKFGKHMVCSLLLFCFVTGSAYVEIVRSTIFT